jgi:hypothetical protein
MSVDNLFPLIGALAEQTDKSEDSGNDGDTTGAFSNGDEERAVQEIESLCVNCEEQVTKYFPPCYILTWEEQSGYRELRDFS